MLKLHTQQFRAPDFLNLSGDYGLCFHPHLYGSDFVKTLRLIEIMMGGGRWGCMLGFFPTWAAMSIRHFSSNTLFHLLQKGTSFFNSPKALCIHKRNIFLRGHGPAPAECRGSLMVLVTWSYRPPCYWLVHCWSVGYLNDFLLFSFIFLYII